MATPYRRGKEYERLLFWRLAKAGWYVVRTPASGAGSGHLIYPDLIAVKGGRVAAVEVKVRMDDRDVYLAKNEFRKLRWLEDQHGIRAFICVYYGSVSDFRCLELGRYSEETERYYAYRRDDFLSKGVRPEEIERYISQHT